MAQQGKAVPCPRIVADPGNPVVWHQGVGLGMAFHIYLSLLIAILTLAFYLYKTRDWMKPTIILFGASSLVFLFEVATKIVKF